MKQDFVLIMYMLLLIMLLWTITEIVKKIIGIIL